MRGSTSRGSDAWAGAHCRDSSGSLVEVFFADDLATIARAKAVCRGCPVARPCLEGALRRGEPWGVWGGELLAAGRIVAVKRPRGRPPKHAAAAALAS